MKVLLLADVPGWIVDRCTDAMIRHMPDIEFRKGFYACMTTDEILAAAAGCDLIHYGNWDIERHWQRIREARKPILMSVRSHRFPPYVEDVARKGIKIHVVNSDLALRFPNATVIPDGLFIEPKQLVVGFAGKPGTYKGTDAIQAACDRIGARLEMATDLAPDEMPRWFAGIDVYCCASEAEGHGTPVIEALALNKPVVSTFVGTAWMDQLPGVIWVRRDVQSIAAGLTQCWLSKDLDKYTWPEVAKRFERLYRSIV